MSPESQVTSSENSHASPDTPATEATKKERKARFSFEENLPKFRELAKAGKSQQEICDTLDIEDSHFFKLYFMLCQRDGKNYKIPTKVAARKCTVKKDGFKIMRHRLDQLGVSDIFSEGKDLDIKREGDTLVISVIAQADNQEQS